MGWLVVGCLLVVTVLRATHLDGLSVIVGAIALTTWIFLPAWVVAVVAGVTRRWLLAGGAVALVGVQLWWIVPEFDPFATRPPDTAGWPTLRILDANLTWTNSDMDGIAAQISRDRPDLVALEEITPSDLAALEASHVLDRFAWSLVVPSEQSEGMALWSDVPLATQAEWSDAGHPELRATVNLAGGTSMAFLVIHTYIPIGLPVNLWKREMAGIATAARSQRGNAVLVGDFNATWPMYEFADILHAGYRDAAVEAGLGWQPTWAPHAGLPALIRIDHALVSADVAVLSYRLAVVPGSEHRSILVAVAVRPAGAAGAAETKPVRPSGNA